MTREFTLQFRTVNGGPGEHVQKTLAWDYLLGLIIKDVASRGYSRVNGLAKPNYERNYGHPLLIEDGREIARIIGLDIQKIEEQSRRERAAITCAFQARHLVTHAWAVINAQYLKEGETLWTEETHFFRNYGKGDYIPVSVPKSWLSGKSGNFSLGPISYNVGAKFWPLPCFNCLSPGFKELAEIITPSESNELTGLVQTQHRPERVLACIHRNKLIQAARAILEAPID